MRKINTLTVRNKFGAVLEMLDADNEPILISKGKELRAVLISYEDFLHRYIDKQAEADKQDFLEQARRYRDAAGPGTTDSLQSLRSLRGYDD
jgi:PHD/YefM family antitoxin component YafN of YafNO toxin-antitoxin module